MVYYIGAHILGNKSILLKIKECKNIGGNAIQIFTKSPINTTDKIKLTQKDINEIKKYITLNNIYLVTHGSYMLNMSWSIHRNMWAIKMLETDLNYTEQIGGIGVVIHMGRATPKLKITKDQAINNFVQSIIMVLKEQSGNSKIILETSCNQTNTIAGTIEELQIIWNKFPKMYKKRLGICIDTAHIFSAGYSIHKPNIFKKYINKFNKLIGIDNIDLFHINDSAAKFNSHLDKHTGLGKGYIYKNNTKPFEDVVNFCFDYNIPMILETHDNYKKEIQFIKKISGLKRNTSKDQLKNKIITILSELAKTDKMNGNVYKHIAYLRAVANLKKFSGDITKINLQTIEGIGKKISAKILEIIKTGKLKQFEIIKLNPSNNAINQLSKIMGIGSVFANKLVNKYKIMNVIELKKAYESKKIKLTNEQKLGIKYYKHLEYLIPRNESTIFKKIIDKKIKKLSLQTIIAGSYRRELTNMGDIDLLIYSHKMDKVPIDLLETIIKKIDTIIVSNISLGQTKYSGLVKLDKFSKVRRLDIRIIAYNSLPTALLYFTGSKEFNKKIRSIAKDKGYLLNEYGLYQIVKNKRIKIKILSEKDVFNKLNINYIIPKNR